MSELSTGSKKQHTRQILAHCRTLEQGARIRVRSFVQAHQVAMLRTLNLIH